MEGIPECFCNHMHGSDLRLTQKNLGPDITVGLTEKK